MTRLVTLHYPLDARCVATILRTLGAVYPDVRLDEDGTIWDGPEVVSEPISAAEAAERVAAKRAKRRAEATA